MNDGHDSFDELLAHDQSPAAQRSALKRRAIALLAQREHSRAELARKLLAGPPPARRRRAGKHNADTHARDADTRDSRRGACRPDEALVESVLDELAALRFLSDERMAESLVRGASARFGSARIAHDMQRKGLTDRLVAETLAPLADTEQERAQALWSRRFGKPPSDMKARARQYRFLMSRGFPARVVSAVVPRVSGARDDAGADEDFPD